jgi:hypothetical protein
MSQPKGDEEHLPIWMPVREFAAIKIVHGLLVLDKICCDHVL